MVNVKRELTIPDELLGMSFEFRRPIEGEHFLGFWASCRGVEFDEFRTVVAVATKAHQHPAFVLTGQPEEVERAFEALKNSKVFGDVPQ